MPEFIDFPVDGRITQRFGGLHGGVDLVDYLGDGAPVYAPCDGTAILHPEGTWGDGTFGNAVILATEDGWFVLMAHLSRYAEGLVDGELVRAGRRIGYQGYTGLTNPDDVPAGSHVHFGCCRVPYFPRFGPETQHLFADPMQFLISEGERMALFQRLEAFEQRVNQFVGGVGDAGGSRLQSWVGNGNIGLLDCLGPQPAKLAEVTTMWDGIKEQTYGTNTLLLSWRGALSAAVPGLVLP